MRAQSQRLFMAGLLLPTAIFALAFLLIPLAGLLRVGATGEAGLAEYLRVLTDDRYRESLLHTFVLAVSVTLTAIAIATVSGLFLQRHRFRGRDTLVAMLTFPLAFPGVVVGFMVIMLAGRQGLFNIAAQELFDLRYAPAYSLTGLFIGYLYFSIPRVLLTVMAAIDKLDPALEEAARSLGASSLQVFRDVLLPALIPAFMASGAICFATAMGAFGTAFSLATDIDVLSMVIYTEFTQYANFATAAVLSAALGLVTWLTLFVTRNWVGTRLVATGA